MATLKQFTSLDELMSYAWARDFGYDQTKELAHDHLGHNLTEQEYANDYEARDRVFADRVMQDRVANEFNQYVGVSYEDFP